MNHRNFSITLVLAFCLLLLLFCNTALVLRGKVAAATLEENPVRALTLKEVDEVTSRLVVRFASPMIDRAQLNEVPAQNPLKLDPPLTCRYRWIDFDELEVSVPGGLPPATPFTLETVSGLRDREGRPVGPVPPLAFHTRPVRLMGTLIEGERNPPRLILLFNHPVDRKELSRRLTLTDGEDRPLRARLHPRKEDSFFLTPGSSPGGVPPRQVNLTIAPGLVPLTGSLPTPEPIRRRIDFTGPLAVRDVTAGRKGIRIELAQSIPPPAKDLVLLDPPYPFQLVRSWRDLRLAGDFPPDSLVQVTLRKGFPGRGRYRLAADYRRMVRIPSLDPALEFATKGSILSSRARPEIEVAAVNVSRLRVGLRTLYPNNAISLAQAHPDTAPDRAFGPWRHKEIALAGRRNEQQRHTLSLADLLLPPGEAEDPLELLEKGLGPGVHQVSCRILDQPRRWLRHRTIRRVIQVTNLGVTARVARGQVLVRVAGLAAGEPVAGAQVRVVGGTNQTLARGRTGAEGTARLVCRPTPAREGPLVIEVHRGPDRTFLALNRHRVAPADDELDGRPYCRGLEAWTTFDRGIIRPGGRITALVVARDERGIAPAGREAELRWLGPGDKLLTTVKKKLPGSGMVTAALQTGPAWGGGRYRLEVRSGEKVIGRSSFRVGAFVPDRLEVAARPAGRILFGRPGELLLQGNWLDGAPAAKAVGRVKVRLDTHRFRPEGYEGYSFGRREEKAPGALPTIPFALDDEGRARVRFDLPTGRDLPQTLAAAVTVELKDPSGRVVRTRLEEPVLRPRRHLGLKAGREAGRLVLVDGAGRPVPEKARVRVALCCRTWVQEQEWRRGRWHYRCRVKNQEVKGFEVEVTGGRARFRIPPTKGMRGAWHVLAATLDGVRVEQPLGHRPLRPDTLRLRLVGEGPLRPGGKARIALDTPFGGNLFLTLEGRGIHGSRSFPVKQGHNLLEMPLPADLELPNIHALATLTRPQAAAGDGPCWMFGGVCLPLEQSRRGCPVELSLPSRVRPRERVEVCVSAPGATRAFIALVDEGVLRITGHPTPDPLGWFLARRRLDSVGADTGTSLFDTARFEPGVFQGGGGLGKDRFRFPAGSRLEDTISQRIHPVALCSGPVELDALGNGAALFELPDYEGRLRVMAVAAGPTQVGAAARPLVVNHPLGLLLAAPRMVAPGDRTGMTLTLANNSGRAGRARLKIECLGGCRLEPDTPALRTLPLERGERKSFFVPFTAGTRPGGQGLRCRVQLGGIERRVEKLVEVRPMTLYAVERIGLTLEGEREIALPGRWRPAGLRTHLHLGARPEGALLPALRDLVRYPYGCVEQCTSSCFALLACRSLMPLLAPPGESGPDVEGLLRAGVDRLLAMQIDSGGLSAWPGGCPEYHFGSLYGLDFLLSVRAAGMEVPESPLERLIDRAEHYLDKKRSTSLRCYAAALLARAGRPVATRLERLAELARRWEDRCRLAGALHRLGRKKRALALLARQAAPAIEEPTPREQSGMLRSVMRRDALELRTLLRVDPAADRVSVLARRLTGRLTHPRRLTTQEKGQALLALAAFHRVAGGKAGPVTCTLAGRGWEKQVTTPARVELDLAPEESFTVAAEARVYAFLEVEGFRLEEEEEKREGMALTRRWLHPASGSDAPRADLEALAGGRRIDRFRRGLAATVLLRGKVESPVENWCLTDILPGGFELDGTVRDVRFWEVHDQGGYSLVTPDRIELRDDRILVFHRGGTGRRFALAYPVRAVFPGSYRRPAASLEALYDPGRLLRGGGGGRMEIGE